MIERYLMQLEQVLQLIPNIKNMTVCKTIYNHKQDDITGSIMFERGNKARFCLS